MLDASALAYIPSPSRGVIDVGPLPLHAYGLCLAAGVLVAVRVAERRWIARGHQPAVADMSVVVVICGIVGARLYHLFTGYDWKHGGLVGTVKIWQGGLSIWGAVAGGLIGAFVVSRRRRLDWKDLIDAMGPAIALGQAIGRWGNWFNQELFGRPTKLPWALKIDAAHRPAGYGAYTTFHPTFLYESLWCLAIYFIVSRLERRFAFRKGQSFALYMTLYTFERFWMELLRIDDATKVFGLRFNALLSAALCVAGTAWFVRLARRAPGTAVTAGASVEGEPPDTEAEASEPAEVRVSDDSGST